MGTVRAVGLIAIAIVAASCSPGPNPGGRPSAVDRAGFDVPAWLADLDAPDLYLTIGGDGAVRVIRGVIAPPSSVDGWPVTLAGSPIDQVIDAIRAVRD